MAIPDYQSIMLPLLKHLGDGNEHTLRETIDTLANQFALTDEERRELLPSGQQAAFDNRVGWARTYMKKACLLVTTRRACFKITDRGLAVLKRRPKEINIAFLSQFPEFVEFRQRRERPEQAEEQPAAADVQTPEEAMESAFQRLRQELTAEILQAIRNCSPAFFERLVIDLLVKMGYGGTRVDAGQAIGRSGDDGIDGIIKEDRLGLDAVYIQAKRWESSVGRPEIQKFAGALEGQRARKGIFITTSSFSQEARDYVSRISSRIVLIDGDWLGQLMMDYDIGVTTTASYALKRVDSDYFSEE